MPLSLNRAARFPPRIPRKAVRIESCLLLPDDREVAVSVRNISAEGFMGECRFDLEPETTFGLSIPDYGIVRAVVRWSGDGTLGAQFVTPVKLERLQEVGD